MLTPAHLELLETIRKEWDKAEQDIKLAEQVCNNIIIPAIKELRYGGRRIAEVLYQLGAGGKEEEIKKLLDDAVFDCYRARHDAIDAATAHIAIDLEIKIEKLGYDAILKAYPKFAELVRELNRVKAKIAESRGQRQNRESIYSALEKIEFPKIVTIFSELKESEPIMVGLARSNRQMILLAKAALVAGVIAILVGLYFGLR